MSPLDKHNFCQPHIQAFLMSMSYSLTNVWQLMSNCHYQLTSLKLGVNFLVTIGL